MTLPYENATSGRAVMEDIQKLLRRFGCTQFGSMEDIEHGEVIVQFKHRERTVIVKASFAGYAAAWLKEHPWSRRSRKTKAQHEKSAMHQAQISVYSILRDWVKGQVTAIEIGMLSFEGAFLGQIMLANGQTVYEAVTERKMLQIEAQI